MALGEVVDRALPVLVSNAKSSPLIGSSSVSVVPLSATIRTRQMPAFWVQSDSAVKRALTSSPSEGTLSGIVESRSTQTVDIVLVAAVSVTLLMLTCCLPSDVPKAKAVAAKRRSRRSRPRR